MFGLARVDVEEVGMVSKQRRYDILLASATARHSLLVREHPVKAPGEISTIDDLLGHPSARWRSRGQRARQLATVSRCIASGSGA